MLFLYGATYSQTAFQKFKSKYDEFDYYAKPSINSDLSNYFKKNINTSLLDAVKFPQTVENEKRIFLLFRLDAKNEIQNMYVTTGYSELNKSIIDAFKKYDIDKLNIPDKNSKNRYVIQIVSSLDGKAILNCSSNIIYDRLPLFEGCETVVTNGDVNKCTNKYIENYIINNISSEIIQNAKIIGELRFNVKFTVDYDGTIKDINCLASTEALTQELNRVIAIVPRAKLFPTRNGNPTFLEIKENIFIIIDSKTEAYKEDALKSNDTLLNQNSDLALHFKKYVTDTELQSMKFLAKQNEVSIFFSIDKKGRYTNVWNNLKDEKSSEKLNSVLKRFPIEKHNINDVNLLANYSYSLITNKNNIVVFQTRKEPVASIPPIFKSCEKEMNFTDLKKCMNERVAYQIKDEFDKTLRNQTDLKGDIRIYSVFKIDTDGKIIDVKVRAPNPYLANEVEEIIKNLPPAIKPGFQNGKPVKVPFSIPIVFRVGENNADFGSDFKNLGKQR